MNIIRLATAKLKLLNMRTSIIGDCLTPLPEDQRNQADRRDRYQRDDEVRTEPIVFLALVEQNLKRSDRRAPEARCRCSRRERRRPWRALEIRRILDHPHHQKQGQHADRQIDVEDPAPGVVVGDPAAQRGTDGRRHDRGDAVERERQPALLRRERVGENGLRHRLQPAAARALQNAEQDQHRQAGRGSAQQRAEREQEDAQQEEALAPEDASRAIR